MLNPERAEERLKEFKVKDPFARRRDRLRDLPDALRTAGLLLIDRDEAGKRVSEDELRAFLDEHAAVMPRTMLRYAIERLEPAVRKQYLAMG